MVVEGEITGLVRRTHLIDFRIAGRQVCIERTVASNRLRDGDHVRVSLQPAEEGPHFFVTAFRGAHERSVHYAGPQIEFSLAILGGLLLATGIFTGIGYLLVPAASLLFLKLLVAADRTRLLAKFRAP